MKSKGGRKPNVRMIMGQEDQVNVGKLVEVDGWIRTARPRYLFCTLALRGGLRRKGLSLRQGLSGHDLPRGGSSTIGPITNQYLSLRLGVQSHGCGLLRDQS